VLGRKEPRTPHSRGVILEVVSDALREIEGHFEMMGFSSTQESTAQAESPDVTPENEEPEDIDEVEYAEDEDSGGDTVFEREEIEVALDVFLSDLVRKKLIKKYKRNKLPTLESVFGELFGDDHQIIKPVKRFEEHIEGYFDIVGYEDMKIAYGELTQIRDIINKELESYAAKQGTFGEGFESKATKD